MRTDQPGTEASFAPLLALTGAPGAGKTTLLPVPEASAWLLLDCPDDVRMRRLRARGWDAERIDQQEPEPTATEVWAWVQRRTGYSQPSN